jgi:hypothetical protein
MTREEIVAAMAMMQDGDVNDKGYQEALIDTFLVAAYVYEDKVKFVFNLGDKTGTSSIPFDIGAVDPDDVCLSDLRGDQTFLYKQFGVPVIMIGELFAFEKAL